MCIIQLAVLVMQQQGNFTRGNPAARHRIPDLLRLGSDVCGLQEFALELRNYIAIALENRQTDGQTDRAEKRG